MQLLKEKSAELCLVTNLAVAALLRWAVGCSEVGSRRSPGVVTAFPSHLLALDGTRVTEAGRVSGSGCVSEVGIGV